MTCIKTGAILFIPARNQYYRSDAFEAEGVMWFRITNASASDDMPDDLVDYFINDWYQWYDENSTTVSTIICNLHHVSLS
jgi:hypothetical protein